MSFNEIINQQKAKDIVLGQIQSKRIPHAYLFLGQDGIGRKKFALELAKTLNCQKNTDPENPLTDACGLCTSCQKIDKIIHPDIQIVDFAYQARLENKDIEKQRSIKINTIREIQKEVNYKPSEGKWKIFIIEPAEKITLDAANCLLKTLEEPPKWTIIILLGKNKENLPATIVSRTQIIPFIPLSETVITNYLIEKHDVPKINANRIASISEGSLGWAISRIEDQGSEVDDIWPYLMKGSFNCDELLYFSQAYYKNANDVLSEMLLKAKENFKRSPIKMQPIVENILYSQKLLERNVNPQMVLDSLFIKLMNY